MTAYATRAPLQLIQNPHMMSEASRGHGRRTSARLADKEDSPLVNGISHENELLKKTGGGSQGLITANETGSKAGGKRKPSEQPWPSADPPRVAKLQLRGFRPLEIQD